MQSLLRDNDHQAEHNRPHFAETGTFVVNLMSSPGAGKTSLLEATIRALHGRLTIAEIEGDLEITKGNACHLDAAMVHVALHNLDLRIVDVLFIENVGNLVCPAGFGLGQHRNVVLLSVTEGDDMPEKYPVMVRAADLLAMTKIDLLAAVGDFQPARATRHLRALANATPALERSAHSMAGMADWIDWLLDQRARVSPSAVAHAMAGHD
jgi:hydrogenase nickel incorporation protein HypB